MKTKLFLLLMCMGCALTAHAQDFADGADAPVEYEYDANGNLTKDLNKNICKIEYGCLNLPRKIVYTNGDSVVYTYDAGGVKHKAAYHIGGATHTVEYFGNAVYEDGEMTRWLMPDGYITVADGKFHYFVKDHQGNIRVVADEEGNAEEVNHYYPFGGLFAEVGNVQPYKYNGKELDGTNGLNLYDYGARQYDPMLGRFTTADPMAEKYYSLSPYQYAANNPVCNIDVNGDSIWFSFNRQSGELQDIVMHVTGKILNDSKVNIDMENAAKSITKAIKRAFNGSIDQMPFNTDIDLSIASSMKDVAYSDHLFVLTDKIIQPQKGEIYGISNAIGGKVSFINAEYFSGIYDKLLGSRSYGAFTAAHEFGHLLGLGHAKSPFNVMRSGGMFYGISENQLINILDSFQHGYLNMGSNYIMMFDLMRPNVGSAFQFIEFK